MLWIFSYLLLGDEDGKPRSDESSVQNKGDESQENTQLKSEKEAMRRGNIYN